MAEVPPDPSIFPESAEEGSTYYYRPGAGGDGSGKRIRLLVDGYNGLTKAFLFNVVLAIGVNVAGTQAPFFAAEAAPFVLLGGLLVLATAVFLLTMEPNRKIGEGKRWSSSSHLIVSTLMALNSALCCGIIGYIVVQQIAANELKRLGLKPKFLGYRKEDVERAIAMADQGSHPPQGPRQ